MACDKMTESKKVGGMGFRNLIGFNLAMLAKIGYRVLAKPNSMLSIVLRDKYFPNSSFLEARQQKKSSWGWKCIILGRQILHRGVRWRVGNGEKVTVAEPWVPKPHSFKPVLRNLDPNTQVCELMTKDRHGWNLDVLAAWVVSEDVELIRSIPFSRQGCEDKRIWHYTKNGVYTVRSSYHVAMEMLKNGEFGRKGGMSSSLDRLGETWTKIWTLAVPQKLWIFMWKASRKAMAVRHNLERRRIRIKNKCELCGVGDETEAHLFFDCEFSRAFWLGTNLQLNMAAMRVNDFLEGWQLLMKRMAEENDADSILQLVIFGFWRIWKCRNELVFKGARTSPQVAVDLW